MNDPVKAPAHYGPNKKIECWDAIDVAIADLEGSEAHYTGCCIKYLWRWGKKHQDGTIDLLKCRRYLDRLISQVKERQGAEINQPGR